MAITRRDSPLRILGFCFMFSLIALRGGTTGLSVGPRTPDAASGSSVDGRLYLDRDDQEVHREEDGASKYLHVGQDPTPSSVDGSRPPILETKKEVGEPAGDILPQPARPAVVVTKRHLLWFGFGKKKEEEEAEKQKEGSQKYREEVEEPDHRGKLQNGNGEPFEEDPDALDDAEHIWHDDDQDEHRDEGHPDGQEADDRGRAAAEEDHHGGDRYGHDLYDDDEDDEEDGEVIHTHGRIVEEAEDLLDEYQQKSLELKEDLTDDEGRETAAARLEAGIDSEIDNLLRRAKAMHGGFHPEDGDDDKEGFMQRMMDAKEAAKKRVKDVLTGRNIHFDSDDL